MKDNKEYNKKFNQGKKLAEDIESYYHKTEKDKAKRMVLMLCYYFFRNGFIVFLFFKMFDNSIDIKVIVATIIVAFVSSFVSYIVNISIHLKHFQKCEEENRRIEEMRGSLAQLAKELDLKPKYTFEEFLINKHM